MDLIAFCVLTKKNHKLLHTSHFNGFYIFFLNFAISYKETLNYIHQDCIHSNGKPKRFIASIGVANAFVYHLSEIACCFFGHQKKMKVKRNSTLKWATQKEKKSFWNSNNKLSCVHWRRFRFYSFYRLFKFKPFFVVWVFLQQRTT